MAELRRIKAAQPALAYAADCHLALLDIHARLGGRVGSAPSSLAPLTGRWAAERRLIEWNDLTVDWTHFKQVFRQVAGVLHRFGLVEADDHQGLQDLARGDDELGRLAAAWYGATGAEASASPLPADHPSALGDVLTWTASPLLTAVARALPSDADLSGWRLPACPICGASHHMASVDGQTFSLACGRCFRVWAWPADRCPSCQHQAPTGLRRFRSADGRYQVAACETCRCYVKVGDCGALGRPLLPIADGIATLPLDAAAERYGYRREEA